MVADTPDRRDEFANPEIMNPGIMYPYPMNQGDHGSPFGLMYGSPSGLIMLRVFFPGFADSPWATMGRPSGSERAARGNGGLSSPAGRMPALPAAPRGRVHRIVTSEAGRSRCIQAMYFLEIMKRS
jgi:hypothetical protein